MIINSIWLLIQSRLTIRILKRQTDSFLLEWVILNFNTATFLSVFIFAYPELLEYHNTVNQDFNPNILIALVLVFRTVADYIVCWKKVYNKYDIDGGVGSGNGKVIKAAS
jgi:hypothetical protein